MSHLGARENLHWSVESIPLLPAGRDWQDSLEMQKDDEDERESVKAQFQAMEAEVRRLTAENRSLREAKLDQEATQLAMDHGFLSPFVLKNSSKFYPSTPLNSKLALPGTPNPLNASAILDDDVNYSFEDWGTPVRDSPTSKLLRTPFRPKPHFITPAMPPSLPVVSVSSLVPDPDLIPGAPATPLATALAPPMTPPARPMPAHLTTHDTNTKIATQQTPFEQTHFQQTPSQQTPYDPALPHTPFRTPAHPLFVTPKNGPFAAREPPTRVLTRVVYIPRTSHWCEHIFQIFFFLIVIFVSAIFASLCTSSGFVEQLFHSPLRYRS